MKPQHSPTPWKLKLPDYDSSFRLSIEFNGSGSFTDRSGELSDVDAAFIVQACNAHEALVEAVKALIAERIPFAPVERGGLGLEYTVENLDYEATRIRANNAHIKALAALKLAGEVAS